MPFTPTHTLAALPIAWLWSRHGTFSALVIGTMVPDWPLYVPIGPDYGVTHSIAGLFIACLPLGFALTVSYHLWLKAALFELLPGGLKVRSIHYVLAPSIIEARTLAAIAIAVVIAAATHVGWDTFTHRGAWGVRTFASLGETAISRGGIDIPMYSVLQHGFTLAGFPVLLLVAHRWYRSAAVGQLPPARLPRWTIWLWRLVLAGVPSGFLSLTALDILSAPSLQVAASVLVSGVTRAGFVVLVLLACYALFFAMTSVRSPKAASGNVAQ